MKAEVLDRVTDLSGVAARLQAGVTRMLEAGADAVEDGIATTKRSLKRGRKAAEDLVEQVSEKNSCPRCLKVAEARYRVYTDVIDMAVCHACAGEARRLGISVEQLDQV
jgi:hypothetical protein